MINYLKQLNPALQIKSILDEAFLKYGKVLDQYDFSQCIEITKTKGIPDSGNVYVASDDELMSTAIAKELSNRFYGNMPIQIGYCNGNSTMLNALEYHKGSEIDVAVTDLVLILADIRDIKHNQLPSTSTEIFFVPQGTAVELYGTTLHFAPCKVSDNGFMSIIVLPEGTNQPLPSIPSPICEEDKLLWMQNKWLIAHKDSIPASKGACVGITGENIEIKYK
ncbi:hypothetical protein Cpap_4071 [Ruminiclostridium papyrosolvens DSM 2782]|uniref:DUF4867 domain-containing protein n=1 Tax=Ruminiclostridium papyrosolvens DSM 2782 TaxID=588581 RepID=F1T832_9FIRM|nr:DUF4867 family protein [Ruminiclostridium papyrosolvens]EGD49630.1 hypothetical protein Cpap_4071 [Ruminiclostridium papyrosolvens DSM 2782]WES33238.1 DUF4867 family protein [Ruminiclostridium papyrosolvens DSM 2782]